MASELFPREKMNALQARTEYVGALLEDEQRLMLVPVRPDNPWEAFRQLRRIMRKKSYHQRPVMLGMYEADAPIQRRADVIPLESRRRAG